MTIIFDACHAENDSKSVTMVTKVINIFMHLCKDIAGTFWKNFDVNVVVDIGVFLF